MEETMNKIDLKNLDKSNWKTYPFEEIAQKISKTVKPEEAEVDVYVGLEHIDGEDIHIRRKGSPSDVKGGKLRCHPGDVIFGKRRAYQRKAAIVDFEGICSAHAFVFRANPEVIDPDLFAFFLHSDQFMHRMVDISVGGLSPTINWGDLKGQEFLLPPKEEQAKIAELLWAMDEVIEREIILQNKISRTYLSEQKAHFSSKKTRYVKLSEISKIRAGHGFPIKYQGDKNKPIKFYKVADMNLDGNERFLSISENTIDEEVLSKIKGKLHPKGTVVFPKVGAAIATEKKRILTEDSIVDNNTMGVALTDDCITPEYLHEFFTTISLEEISNKGTVPSINASIISDVSIGIPEKEDLLKYLEFLESYHDARRSLKKRNDGSKNLLKSIINEVF
jgi:type I restriction enzyme S subunit